VRDLTVAEERRATGWRGARDADLVGVLALRGPARRPVSESLVRLLEPQAVPFLAAYQYTDPGLRKREAWEQTWVLQRSEDAGEHVGTVPVTPKHTSADYRKASYWQARGKLDVLKEGFILYPDAGRDTDPTPQPPVGEGPLLRRCAALL